MGHRLHATQRVTVAIKNQNCPVRLALEGFWWRFSVALDHFLLGRVR